MSEMNRALPGPREKEADNPARNSNLRFDEKAIQEMARYYLDADQ